MLLQNEKNKVEKESNNKFLCIKGYLQNKDRLIDIIVYRYLLLSVELIHFIIFLRLSKG